MTLTIDLTPEEEARLQAAARSQGVGTAEYVRRLIETHLPDREGASLAELMAAWIAEDATDDPAEQEARDVEWHELKARLNANRAATGEPPLFP